MRLTRVAALLDEATAHLGTVLPDSPRLDATLLLSHVLGWDRTQLTTAADTEVDLQARDSFWELVEQRRQGRPIAQLLGCWEFYSLDLFVNDHVLVPRPETELLVDWARELLDESSRRVADICTGTGCLAIAIAKNCPGVEVVATDVSPEALAVAQQNVDHHELHDSITLLQGDLLTPLEGEFDLVVTNPPYVAINDPLLSAHVAQFEPSIALLDCHDGDGLGFYRRLSREFRHSQRLLCEVGETQAREVVDLFENVGYRGEIRCDLAGIERAVLLTRL